ncbi:MAG: right-handed parallel beta-helix repeat-containing protein [Lachnospiraceae bacterium]|nr:right-handed parallel beta-helix repeat-containing protein [Lachnospiraceae bacterium]
MRNGDVDYTYTGIVKSGDTAYYVKEGRVLSIYTGVIAAQNQVWYVENGIVDPDVSATLNTNRIDVTSSAYGATPNDDTDDTYAINQAIRAADALEGGVVYIPSGRYRINGDGPNNWDDRCSIRMDGQGTNGAGATDITIVMEPDTILEVIPSANEGYSVIFVRHASDITIIGGQIVGDRYDHTGTGGEFGHGISVYASDNVRIIGVTIKNCWGDGIYLGTSTQTDTVCNGVEIRGCNLLDNRRNNVSIVHADNVVVDSCTISNANGTEPQSGICIEPNHINQVYRPNQNITITNTTITQSIPGVSAFHQFALMTVGFANYTDSAVLGLTIANCVFNGDLGNLSGKNTVISDSTVNGTLYYRFNQSLRNVRYSRLQKW